MWSPDCWDCGQLPSPLSSPSLLAVTQAWCSDCLTSQRGDGLLERDWGKPLSSCCGEGEKEEHDRFAVLNWDAPSWLARRF